MKKLLLLIGTAVVLTAAFTVVLTARYVPTETPVPPADEVAVLSGAAERLANAIRIPTISAEDEAAFDAAAFADLHAPATRVSTCPLRSSTRDGGET